MNVAIQKWDHPEAPSGVERLAYRSDRDGARDWALACRPRKGHAWVVHLHGHGSSGDQIYTRTDIRERHLSYYLRLGFGVLSPNLRGNAWMCPDAVADLHRILDFVRREYGGNTFLFVSGSMGGTGNLIYATAYPEDVSLVVALCSATDIASYHQWCCAHPGGVRETIRLAIESAYGGRPDHVPQKYCRHCVIRHADRLTMPLFLSHATGDKTIPVEQSRRLWQRLSNKPNVTYVEIAGGHHDSPLRESGMLDWLDMNVQRLQLHVEG